MDTTYLRMSVTILYFHEIKDVISGRSITKDIEIQIPTSWSSEILFLNWTYHHPYIVSRKI